MASDLAISGTATVDDLISTADALIDDIVTEVTVTR
jgi:hypothetical protein